MEEKIYIDILHQLTRIADGIEFIAHQGEIPEPNYVRQIGEYPSFNWPSIDAEIVKSDKDGATIVLWNGALYTRRSPSNKFEPAIFFSRAAGKDAEGNVKYYRLITFRTIKDADPIPDKVAAAIPAAQASKPAQTISKPAGKTDKPAPSVTPASGKDKPAASTNGNGNQSAAETPSGPYGATKFYQEAAGKRFALPMDWAKQIAGVAGIDLKVKNPSFTPAAKLLPYFAEGKANGFDFDMLAAILKECHWDPREAAIKMRANVPGGA